MTTLAEALDQSYRGILNGTDLATAHLGDQTKQWAVPVEVARNLFTNPNLVGDGTYAEVRRNGIQTPHISASTSGWIIFSSSQVALEGARQFTTNAVFGANNGFVSPLANVAGASIVSGGVQVAAEFPVRVYVTFRDASGELIGHQSTAPSVELPAGGGVAEFDSVPVPSNAVTCGSVISVPSGTRPAGAVFTIYDGATLSPGVASAILFTGSSPQGSIDPDMRQRWLGAENASESVMEIERVRGLTAVRCVAGVSTRDGKPAIRAIPTEASSALHTAVTTSVPVGARSGGTWVATLHSEDASYVGGGFRLLAQTPSQVSPTASSPGITPLKLTFSELTSSFLVGLLGGLSVVGSGDVWWTDIGLFEGTYDGPAFSGDSSPDPDTIAEWAGPRNASESILWGWPE